MPASSRRYPWVGFTPDREAGKDILHVVERSTRRMDGVQAAGQGRVLHRRPRGRQDRLCRRRTNRRRPPCSSILDGASWSPTSGSFKWGVTITTNYFPKDNTKYFDGCDLNLMRVARASIRPNSYETYLRGFLGRMLFSGDDVYKPVKCALRRREGALSCSPA